MDYQPNEENGEKVMSEPEYFKIRTPEIKSMTMSFGWSPKLGLSLQTWGIFFISIFIDVFYVWTFVTLAPCQWGSQPDSHPHELKISSFLIPKKLSGYEKADLPAEFGADQA